MDGLPSSSQVSTLRDCYLQYENPSKMMKNTFYFTLKALFVLKIFKFFVMVFWSCIKTAWLDRSVKFQNLWCHILAIHILPNISKSKVNQTMKSRQFMEYYITNIFLEKSFTKYGGETVPTPFFKKSKLKISLDRQPNILYSLFLLHA